MKLRAILGCLVLAVAGCSATQPLLVAKSANGAQPRAAEQQAEQRAILIAQQAVARNDRWPLGATYRARRDRGGWAVLADRIEGYDFAGRPQHVAGGHRLITIDTHWRVTDYLRGR